MFLHMFYYMYKYNDYFHNEGFTFVNHKTISF
jgi:hypothetical protein